MVEMEVTASDAALPLPFRVDEEAADPPAWLPQ